MNPKVKQALLSILKRDDITIYRKPCSVTSRGKSFGYSYKIKLNNKEIFECIYIKRQPPVDDFVYLALLNPIDEIFKNNITDVEYNLLQKDVVTIVKAVEEKYQSAAELNKEDLRRLNFLNQFTSNTK